MAHTEKKPLKAKLRNQISLKWIVYSYKRHMNGLVFKFVFMTYQSNVVNKDLGVFSL